MAPSHLMAMLSGAAALLVVAPWFARAYEVNFDRVGSSREICSGMYGGENAHIVLTFNPRSEGHLAVAIYEWSDVEYLGVNNVQLRDDDPSRIYICTTEAIQNGLCSPRSLGSFITSIPDNVFVEDTSLMITSVSFGRLEIPDQGTVAEIGTPDDFTPEGDEAGGSSAFPVSETAQNDQSNQDASDVGDEPSEIDAERPDPTLGSIEDLDQVADAEHQIIVEDEHNDGPTEDNWEAEESPEGSVASWPEEEYAEPDSLDQGFSEGDFDGAALPTSDAAKKEGITTAHNSREPSELDSVVRYVRSERSGEESPSREGSFSAVIAFHTMQRGGHHELAERPEAATHRSDRSRQLGARRTSPPHDRTTRQTDDLILLRARTSNSTAGVTLVGRNSRQIVYQVPQTGYYCVGIVPMVAFASKRAEESHSSYSGTLLFKNAFEGRLRAVDYPRMQFFTATMYTYVAIATAWIYASVKHSQGLFMMQWAVAGILLLLITEYAFTQGYYRYSNHHAGLKGSTALLIIAAFLNALRNTLSLLLLLLVCKGWGVMKMKLDDQLKQMKILAGCHWTFGVAYAITSICVDMETASRFIVTCLLLPLTATLGIFLAWIFVSLRNTSTFLLAHGQTAKFAIFKTLNIILAWSIAATLAIVVYSYSVLHSNSSIDFPADTWRTRWVVTDGLPSATYIVTFSCIAWLLRPSENSYQLAMSEQISGETDDIEDAHDEQIELGELQARQPLQA